MESLRSAAAKMLDCGLEVNKFELQSCYYVPFRVNNHGLPSQLGLWNTPTVSLQMVNPHNVYPRYDTKQYDDEVPVMLELWRMQSTPLLPSLLGPF